MTHFKNTNKKLERLRGIFFQIGLIIAGGLTLVAFEWTSPIYISELPTPDVIAEEPWDMIPIIPIEEEVEKPKVEEKNEPKTNPDKLEIVKNDVKEIEKKEEKKKEEPKFDKGEWKEVEKIEDEKPVFLAGVMPHFKNCAEMEENQRKSCTQSKMFEHFGKSIRVPEKIKVLGSATYKAYVYFEVSKQGEIVNVKVMNDEKHKIPKELERQAYNAVNSLPKMNPGKNHGKPVRVKYTLPIVFNVI